MSAPATRGRPAARVLLVAMILAITLGPRIRLPGLLDRAVDLRVQDFLLLPVLAYVGTRLPSLRQVWGPWPAMFAFGSITVTVLHLALEPTMSLLRTVGYLGRTLETFGLALAIAGLYRLAGDRAWRTALNALHLAVAANAAWVGYQYAIGAKQTLLGSGVGDLIESYGPKLVGEASSFGTGFFFASAAALGCAELLTRATPRWIGVALLLSGVLGAYLSQSRVSLSVAAMCAVAVVLLPDAQGRRRVFTALVLAGAAIIFVPRLPQVGRLSESGFEAGFGARTTPIWDPLLHVLGDHPLIGIGTGQLGTHAYPWTEAHNIALRAALDYGVIVGALFLAAYLAIGWRAGRTVLGRDETPPVRLWAVLALLLVAGVVVAGIAQDSLIAVTSTHLVMLAAGLLGGARLGPLPDRQKRTAVERRVDLVRQHTKNAWALASTDAP